MKEFKSKGISLEGIVGEKSCEIKKNGRKGI